MKAILLCIVAVFTFADSRGEVPEPSRRPEVTRTIDAKLDDKGRVILWEREGRSVAVGSGQNFGMMVYYNKYEANPRPFYRIFLQSEHKIVETESFANFATTLNRIPSASRVYLFDLCTSGSHYGMPKKFMDDIRAALKKRKLKLTDPGYIICTCPG